VHRRTELGGLVLRPGNRMVLDVLGIDHDPARWPDPRRFDPQRMLSAQPGAYDFVPQGGGHPTTGHRCPGESVALCLLDVTLRVLAQLDHDVESSHVRRSRIPTLPDRGLVVRVPALVRP
jgi:fatty-acid peroxygenase